MTLSAAQVCNAIMWRGPPAGSTAHQRTSWLRPLYCRLDADRMASRSPPADSIFSFRGQSVVITTTSHAAMCPRASAPYYHWGKIIQAAHRGWGNSSATRENTFSLAFFSLFSLILTYSHLFHLFSGFYKLCPQLL